MPQQNTIALKISDQDMAQIQGALGTLNAKLLPYLKTLTATQRMELPKMGDLTVPFVEKSLEYGRLFPDLVPSFLDLEALAVDYRAVRTLRALAQTLAPVTAALEDSMILSGSEAYQGALVFYNSVKSAAKLGVTGAQACGDDLATRFPGAPAKKKLRNSDGAGA